MKHRSILSLGVILNLFLFGSTIISQEAPPADELYILHEDAIKIDMVDKYEETVKKELEMYKKYNMETVVKFASQTDDYHYYYLTPIENYSGIDLQDKYWQNFSEKVGKEKLSELYENYEGTYEYHRNLVLKRSADLTYMPENPRLKPEERKFVHYDHYYVKEGSMNEAMKMMKKYKDIMMKTNSQDAYNVWMADMGGEIGWVVVTRYGKSSSDYYTQADKMRKEAPEELKGLWEKFAPLLKKWSHNNGVSRPDFTYAPEK